MNVIALALATDATRGVFAEAVCLAGFAALLFLLVPLAVALLVAMTLERLERASPKTASPAAPTPAVPPTQESP